jgi:hypothetical protein
MSPRRRGTAKLASPAAAGDHGARAYGEAANPAEASLHPQRAVLYLVLHARVRTNRAPVERLTRASVANAPPVDGIGCP